ncbi:MAG TPA: hypothetical protein VG406_14860 [Isosphaeraceae bacterium]|jgi:hypothetical protein|nr:hypothetical protein [Isosphaeraceae bacterium]
MNTERPRTPEDLDADRAARFDRLWEATRPSPPSAAVRDVLWANVAHALDAGPAPEPAPSWWVRRAWSVRVVAAAAAVLVAVLLVARDRDRGPGRPEMPVAQESPIPVEAEPPAVTNVVLDAGAVAVLHADDRGAVQVTTHPWDTTLADDFTGIDFGSSASELDVIAALEDMGLSSLALDTTNSGTLP